MLSNLSMLDHYWVVQDCTICLSKLSNPCNSQLCIIGLLLIVLSIKKLNSNYSIRVYVTLDLMINPYLEQFGF